jgi:hypothetical protein
MEEKKNPNEEPVQQEPDELQESDLDTVAGGQGSTNCTTTCVNKMPKTHL